MSLGFYKCVEEKICQGLFLGPKNMYMVYVLYIYMVPVDPKTMQNEGFRFLGPKNMGCYP